jgi:hypothetical protein
LYSCYEAPHTTPTHMRFLTASAMANVALAFVFVSLCISQGNLASGFARTRAAGATRTPSALISRDLSARASMSSGHQARRNFLQAGTAMGLGALATAPNAGAKGLKGFLVHKDGGDKYQFAYPFGWEEVYVASGVCICDADRY